MQILSSASLQEAVILQRPALDKSKTLSVSFSQEFRLDATENTKKSASSGLDRATSPAEERIAEPTSCMDTSAGRCGNRS